MHCFFLHFVEVSTHGGLLGGGGAGDDEGGGGQWCENVQTPSAVWYLPQGGGGGGGALGGQSRHTCPSGRQSFSHPKKSLKRMPGRGELSDCESNSFSFCPQASEGSKLRYESSMRSSKSSLTVPDPSASAIWKSECTHFLNSGGRSNEEHGVDGLGGGGDGSGGDGGGGHGHHFLMQYTCAPAIRKGPGDWKVGVRAGVRE